MVVILQQIAEIISVCLKYFLVFWPWTLPKGSISRLILPSGLAWGLKFLMSQVEPACRKKVGWLTVYECWGTWTTYVLWGCNMIFILFLIFYLFSCWFAFWLICNLLYQSSFNIWRMSHKASLQHFYANEEVLHCILFLFHLS